MISLMMQLLLPPVALLLLSIIPTETKVVTSMAECNEFFLQQTPPNIPGILEGGNIKDQNRYKPICQTLNGTRRFVTLYDITNKIPVFSAAKYSGGGGKRPKNPWKIEPQLENLADGDNMIDANINYSHQAGKTDYADQQAFDKGHLLPCSYKSDESDKISTFALTNTVPQIKKFNQESWNSMEQCVRCILDNYCINNNNNIEGFVVIGAQPSGGNMLKRINIPSVLWSAFCCYNGKKSTWLASAHWGDNKDGGPKYLQTKTLAELHNTLKIEAFPGTKCPGDKTVTPLYSEDACKSICKQK